MSDETHNGWTNWDTWNAHLWISATEWAYFAARTTVDAAQLERFVVNSGLRGDDFDPWNVNWEEVWQGINGDD